MIEMRQNAKLQAWHTCKLDYKGYGTRRRRSTCQSLGSFGNLSMDAHNVALFCKRLHKHNTTWCTSPVHPSTRHGRSQNEVIHSDVCRYIRLETYGDQIYPFLLLVLCAKLAKLAMGNSDQLNKHHHCIFPSFHLTRRQDLANARHQRGSRKGLATLVLTSTLQYYAEPFHCGDHSLAVCLALRLLN